MIKLTFVGLYFLSSGSFAAHQLITPSPLTPETCLTSPERQELISNELQTLLKADQDERDNWDNMTEEEWMRLSEHDLHRRQRVGELFGEGCLMRADDFTAASLIYQHGDTSDHYYAAFTWAERAVALGDTKQKPLIAVTIDRYLHAIGHKQLFGSQAYAYANDPCYCLVPVESSFPDTIRLEYNGTTLADEIKWLNSLNEGKSCPSIECPMALKPTPKGTVIGFW